MQSRNRVGEQTMPPNNPDSSVGLPSDVMDQLLKFSNTRKWLYYLYVAWIVFSTVAVLMAPLDTVEPVRWLWWLHWLPDFMAGFAPGLPEYLINVALRYPLQVLALFLVYLLIRRVSFLVKAAEGEYAFQAWQRTAVAGANELTTPTPNASLFARTIQCLPPFIRVVIAALALIVLFALLDLIPRPADAADRLSISRTLAETAVGCANTRGLCRLAPGEKMQITIRADQRRNETGVWLEEDVSYTARFMGSHDWQDARREVGPQGFEFDPYKFGWRRFWWAEWMRPFREGVWFQVVGRIDRNREVFAVLGAEEASKPHAFKTPASGELVLFVNDAIYWNNRGVMTIEICHCAADAPQQGS